MAKEANMMQKVGSWSFIIGVVIALFLGFITKIVSPAVTMSILVVLGLIVGFLNVTGKETMPFLLAAVSLVIVTSFGGDILGSIQLVGEYLKTTLNSMTIFVMAATIVVALKAIYALAADE